MKKKGHENRDPNFIKLKSDNPFLEDVFVHIIGDKVFIETEDNSICMSREEAKHLSNYLHDMVVRPVDNMFGDV